jgi:hypothetical protein
MVMAVKKAAVAAVQLEGLVVLAVLSMPKSP